MVIKSVNDPTFKKYGKVIKGIDFSNITREMMNLPCPDGEVVYEPGVAALENTPEAKVIQHSLYGGMPIQIGHCSGDNTYLNAVEYHRDSEINVAVTDLIMLWGSEQDITEDLTYDTSLIEAFLIPAGTAVECYATTLHYAPCNANGNKFRCVVVLPKGTNTDVDVSARDTEEDKLLFARNKWLISHKDAGIDGSHVGLIGENIHV